MKLKAFGRTRRSAITALLVGLIVLALAVGGVLAMNDDGFFELGPGLTPTGQSGGITDILGDTVASTGPDWADLFDANGNLIPDTFGPGGIAAAFLKDPLSQKGASDATTFSGAGGSNKNNDLITAWHWDSGNTPAKDDLSNVYAYAVIGTTGDHEGHLIVYSGFERLAPEGDSHIDIEFFQDQVALDEDVPCNDPGNDVTPCGFSGVRTENDLIVSMDFVQGGGLGEVSIHRWDGTEYVLEEDITSGEVCNADDTVCAFNNGGTIDGGPWPNYDRGGAVITDLPQNSFTEIGVDVTALFDGVTPCFTTYMGKTRSSDSFTAELKDFAGPGSFPICGANITINPDGVNIVGEPHTFTVNAYAVTGNVPAPAPDGTIVTVTLTATDGAVVELISDTCADPGTVSGSCSVTFTSDTTGYITGHAEADITFGGHTFHTETDGAGGNSDDAVKQYIAGSLAWLKNDNAGRPLAGATFQVCRTHDGGGVDIVPDECVSVTDNAAPDVDPDAGQFLLTGMKLGTYTVTETAAPPGYQVDPTPQTAELTLADHDETIAIAFVNTRPVLKLSAFGYTNEPTGTPTDGVVSGTTTYTVKIKNFGSAAATSYNGTLSVSENSAGGTLNCGDVPNNSLTFTGGPLAAGAEGPPVTLTCIYTNLDDASVVTANLSAVQYTLNNLARTASGTPATISFTIQSD